MVHHNEDDHDVADSLKRSVLRGTVGAFIVRGLAAGAGLAAYIVLARILTLPDYGVVALGLSWLSIMGTVACFGTDTVALRFISVGIAKRDRGMVAAIAIWSQCLSLKIGAFITPLGIMFVIAIFNDYSNDHLVALSIIIIATPLLSLTLTQSGVLKGGKRVVLGAVVETFLRPTLLLFLSMVTWLAIGGQVGVTWIAAYVVLAQVVTAIVSTNSVRSYAAYGVGERSSDHSQWIGVARPIATMNILGVVIVNVDMIAIGYFLQAEGAAVYRASIQLANLVAFGLAAANGIVAPLIAELYSSGSVNSLQRVLRFSVCLVTLGSLFCVSTLAIFGESLLGIFGHEYKAGFNALLILLVGQAVNALCGPTGLMMSMTGHQKQAMWVFIASVAVSLTLSLVLVPRIGIVGGAVANVAGISLWNICLLLYIQKKLNLDPSILCLVPSSRTRR